MLAETIADYYPELDDTQKKQALDEVVALLHDDDYAPLFSDLGRAEVPVAGEINGKQYSARIDRLFVDNEHVMIVDYKSNVIPPTTIEAIPAAYIEQLSVYRALIQHVYPEKRITCALLWTAETRMMKIPDSLLDTHAAP